MEVSSLVVSPNAKKSLEWEVRPVAWRGGKGVRCAGRSDITTGGA